MKRAYVPISVRGKMKAFFIAASVLLITSLTCAAGVGFAFRCSLYTFCICLSVISPLILMALCGWATHKRLYRGARSGMAIWPLLKYAVRSDEYRVFGRDGDWLGKNALYYGNPWIGPWDPRE